MSASRSWLDFGQTRPMNHPTRPRWAQHHRGIWMSASLRAWRDEAGLAGVRGRRPSDAPAPWRRKCRLRQRMSSPGSPGGHFSGRVASNYGLLWGSKPLQIRPPGFAVPHREAPARASWTCTRRGVVAQSARCGPLSLACATARLGACAVDHPAHRQEGHLTQGTTHERVCRLRMGIPVRVAQPRRN